MAKPRNVILIVADSLRYDAVYHDGGLGIPYLENNGTQFTNARSAACWTLPATTSMFTGMMPHEQVIVAVNHEQFTDLNDDFFKKFLKSDGIIVDVKGDLRNKIKEFKYWSL